MSDMPPQKRHLRRWTSGISRQSGLDGERPSVRGALESTGEHPVEGGPQPRRFGLKSPCPKSRARGRFQTGDAVSWGFADRSHNYTPLPPIRKQARTLPSHRLHAMAVAADKAGPAPEKQRELQDFRAKIGSDSVMGMVASHYILSKAYHYISRTIK